jgi:Fe-S-cluster containining protein
LNPRYAKHLLWAARKRKLIQLQFKNWKQHPPSDLDATFHKAHEAAFAETDCLACANCCRTTSPIFKERDIVRIAKHTGRSVSSFTQRYLQRDSDGDWVLQKAPCSFLDLASNRCSIYDVRPEACRAYPHTDRKNMREVLAITEQNTHLCPAVARMMESILDSANA